jgi:radical SAM superfamily enzyme YgiQ (UPF0313 family)
MKLLLSIPPWTYEDYPESMMDRQGVASNRWGTITGVSEPLGILSLAAAVRTAGHEPAILDGFAMPEEEWLRRLRAQQPSMLGLSLTAFSFDKAVPLVRKAKEILPDLKLVIGGPYPNAVGPKALEQMPEADYAIRGFAERSLTQLCNDIDAGRCPNRTPQLIYRTAEGIRENPAIASHDMSTAPVPARDLVDMRQYRPSVGFYNRLPSAAMVTTVGCPMPCSFCVSSNTVTYRPPDMVVAEIEELVGRYGIRHVVFWDEDLAIKRSHISAICEGILRKGLDISFCGNMVIDRVRPELLALMKRAGCWKLLFGLESGVEKNLKMLGKTFMDRAKIHDRLAMVQQAGIETFATLMFGIPGETRAEAEETIDWATTLPLDYAVFLNFTPFPGTPYYSNLSEYGTFRGMWSNQAVSFVPHTMTLEDLQELRVMAYRKFYLRPRYMVRRLTHLRTRDDWSRSLRGLVATLRLRPAGISPGGIR